MLSLDSSIILYIDPGTGSMLFSVLIGLIGASFYAVRIFFVKIKTLFGGKKQDFIHRKIPFVIYSDHKRYWPIFEAICKKLDEQNIEMLYLTSSEDDPAFNANLKNMEVKFIGSGNKPFFTLNYLKAYVLLSTTPGLGVYQWKRSKNVSCYVHITHMAGNIIMYRTFGVDYYDTLLLSGEFQINDVRKLEKIRNLPAKQLEKVGIPYMDEMVKRLKNAPPIKNQVTNVLIAPTWGSSSLFVKSQGKIIDELLKTDYHIIIRPHPQSFTSEKELMEELMQKYPNSDRIEWNRDVDNFEVLRKSDILISDFSGVIFDFALVYEKPVIYTEPNIDLGPYDAWWFNQGTSALWTVRSLPKLGKELKMNNLKNIKQLIDDCLTNDKYKETLQNLRNEVWEHYGEGAERTVKFLMQKYQSLLEQEAQKTKKTKKHLFKTKK